MSNTGRLPLWESWIMNNPKNQPDRYKLFGYEITGEPDFMDKEFGITAEIKKLIQDTYYEVMEKKKGTTNKLLKIIYAIFILQLHLAHSYNPNIKTVLNIIKP